MAEVLTRLRVDSREYDSKIERARNGLLQLDESLRSSGKTMKDATDEQVKFARGLGNMQTVATTTRGKLSELTKAYTDLSVKYKSLTDEEKNSPMGKALGQSLDQLRGRIQETKQSLNEVSKELGDTGKQSDTTSFSISSLSEKFGINLKALTAWGAALAVGKGALELMKDAFGANEAAVDEWGRIMESSSAVYDGFLHALNTGDISGYLSRIDDIVAAARKAYDEIDRLGTLRTIQAPQQSAQEVENERMRAMIQTRRYIAPRDGRTPSMQEGQLLNDTQIKRLEQQLENGMKAVLGLVQNELDQSTRAINAVYETWGNNLNMSVSEFRKGTSSMGEFERRVAGGQKYNEWRNQHATIDLETGRPVYDDVGNPYKAYRGWSEFRVDGPEYNDLVRRIQERDQLAQRSIGTASQAYRTINRAEGITSRIGGRSSGGGSAAPALVEGGLSLKPLADESIQTTESMKQLQAQLSQFTAALASATNAADYRAAEQGISTTKAKMAAQPYAIRMGVSTDSIIEMEDQVKEAMEEMKKNLPKLEIETVVPQGISKDGKDTAAAWQAAASAVNSVGSALQGLENPSAKIAGIVGQAIANIALGFAQASAKDSKLGVWGWIAAIAGGLGTMISTIGAIKSATSGYADGGIIRGNSYSGDLTTTSMPGVNVNAGELVLNRAQQGNLAAQLSTSPFGGARLEATISGEQIRLALNNNSRRRGRGEYVTSRRIQ